MVKNRWRSPRMRHMYAAIMISAIAILIVTAVTYLAVRDTLVSKMIEDSVGRLTSIMELQDTVLGQAERTLNTLTVDPDITYFPQFSTENQYVKMVSAFQSISRICSENDYIDRIAVYYIDEGTVLATGWGVSTLADYLYSHEDTFMADTPSRGVVLRTSPPMAEDATGEIELLRYLPLNYITRPKAVLAIQLSGEYFKSLHNLINGVGGDFFLTNAAGELIYGSMAEIPQAVQAALLEPTEAGGVYYTIQNQQLVSHVASLHYGLSYSFRIPVRHITADVNFLFYFVLCITAAVILLGVFGAAVIVRRWYKPLDSLLLEGYGATQSDYVRIAPKEAAQKIRGLYEENRALLTQNQDMQALFEQHRLAEKNQFLRELLSGDADAATLHKNLSEYGIHWEHGARFAVAVLSIDEYAQYRNTLSAMDRSMFSFHLAEMARRAFLQMAACEPVEMDGSQIACVLAMLDAAADETRLAETTAALCAQIIGDTGISVTIGLSECLTGIQGIPACFRHALQARDQRWMSGFGRAYFYQAEAPQSHGPAYPHEMEKEILVTLKSNKAEETMDLLDTFFQLVLESAGTNVQMVQHCFLQLLTATYRCLYESYGAYIARIPSEKEMYGELLAAQTAAIMNRRLRDFYAFLLQLLQPAYDERYTALARQVQAYIAAHSTEDLSVEHLADVFALSTSHLRRIFKERTGKSIKAYMDYVRVEKACALLAGSNRSISDIGVEVGYVSLQTFLRVFKKECGVTPSEYRKAQVMSVHSQP